MSIFLNTEAQIFKDFITKIETTKIQIHKLTSKSFLIHSGVYIGIIIICLILGLLIYPVFFVGLGVGLLLIIFDILKYKELGPFAKSKVLLNSIYQNLNYYINNRSDFEIDGIEGKNSIKSININNNTANPDEVLNNLNMNLENDQNLIKILNLDTNALSNSPTFYFNSLEDKDFTLIDSIKRSTGQIHHIKTKSRTNECNGNTKNVLK